MSTRTRKLQSEYFVEVACFGEAEKMVTSVYFRGMGSQGRQKPKRHPRRKKSPRLPSPKQLGLMKTSSRLIAPNW